MSENTINLISIIILIGVSCWFSYMIGHLRGYDAANRMRDELDLDTYNKRR